MDAVQHPKDVGDRTQLAVMLALRDAGYAVLVPFGENTRYDLVIDDGTSLRRIQCKTGRLREGAVRFNVCSCYGHHLRPGNSRRGYRGEIDLFGVYCPDTRTVYLVPIDDVPAKSQAALRVEPTKNKQRRRIRHANAYALALVSSFPREELAATAGARAPSA